MTQVDVLCRAMPPGWIAIEQLARVAAEVFDAPIRRINTPAARKRHLLRHLYLPPRRRKASKRAALIIATDPDDLLRFYREPGLFGDYKEIAIYICDSFALAKIRRLALFRRVDLIVRMRPFNEDFYSELMGDRTIYAPFGADVLGLGGWEGPRGTDVLRVGRQPEEWDDDAISAARLGASDLRFAGRPPFADTPEAGMALLFEQYRNSKVTLAHSNLICGHLGTHASLDYVTARWTDAAANGTLVAGHQPTKDRSLTEILWPELLVHFDSRDPQENIAQLNEVVARWTPEAARFNYKMALKRLDWRWRLKDIASYMGWTAPGLETAMSQLTARIEAVDKQL